MSSESKSNKAIIFETILSGPGMDDIIKVSLPVSRKNILVLCRVIDQELVKNQPSLNGSFFGSLISEASEDFLSLQKMILEKAGLEKFYERLKSLE